MRNLKEILLFCFYLMKSFSLCGLDNALIIQIQELVASNPFQLSAREYTYLAEEIEQLAPCNVLVFGLGNDSALWDQINTEGKTVFLEHNLEWYKKISSRNPRLNCYLVQYHTRLSEWKILLNQDPIELKMDLPLEERLGIKSSCFFAVAIKAPKIGTSLKQRSI